MNKRQALFVQLVLGTLVYSVVLGFFNDHTSLVTSSSYAITFLVSIVLELLTYSVLKVKRFTLAWFGRRDEKVYKYGSIISVWLILFLSKFIFLDVLDLLFKSSIYIEGFIGISIVVLVMMVAKSLVDIVYKKLGD